jgi:serine/threonine protein kinase
MTEQKPNLCPECGKPVPAESQHQLCPACLMAQAFASCTIQSQAGTPERQSPPLSPDDIADKFPLFEITECLGRGGMGVVYKARQKSLDRWVAIKILAPERVGQEKFAERFAREAATLAKLSHPNIVTIHDFGQTDGLFYLVMEFVDGVNLRELLRESKLAPEQALAIVPPICDALQYAHDKGIVHRDIKPENLLLDREGRVKIADFGIAALVGAEGEPAGTPPYMAPEQAETRREVDNRADIYALGVVLYEMLTGERPGKELIAPSKKVQVDVRLDEVVLRALEKKPELRYQQASFLKTQLETLSQQPHPQEPPESPTALEEPGSRELRMKIRGVTAFCFLSAAGMASHLPASDPRFLVGAWAVLFLGATLAALFAARKAGRKLLMVSKLADLNAVGTLAALMACVAEIPWLLRLWIVLIEAVLATGFLLSLAQLFRGGLLPFSLQAQIWSHMSAREKREMMLRNLMFIVWNLATWFVPIFILLKVDHMRWAYAGGVLALGFSAIPLWLKILREGQAATAWATERGITPDKLKEDYLNAAPRWVRLLFGPGIMGVFFTLRSLAHRSHWSDSAALSVWLIACFGLTFLFLILVEVFRRDQSPAQPIDPSKNKPAPPPARSESSDPAPRFSRTAIIGALWIPVFLFAIVGSFVSHTPVPVPEGIPAGPAWWQRVLAGAVIFLGLAAPFGTTILGWIAVSQIRNSGGKLYGMWLALFDGLIFPLLALDGLVGWWIYLLIDGLGHQAHPDWQVNILGVLLVTIPILIALDLVIARIAWRAATRKPGENPGPRKGYDKSRLAVFIGCVALGLLVLWGGSSLFRSWISSRLFQPSRLPSATDFHCRVFEADAALVDELIPSDQRKPGIQPDAKRYMNPGTRSGTYYQGKFAMKYTGGEVESLLAEITSQTLDSLLKRIPAQPGILQDSTCEVTSEWWAPGLADARCYSRCEGGFSGTGGANGCLGFRTENGIEEVRLECSVEYGISVPPPEIASKLLYEGKRPSQGRLLAFLVPFLRQDGSAHYLVMAYEFSPAHALHVLAKPAPLKARTIH